MYPKSPDSAKNNFSVFKFVDLFEQICQARQIHRKQDFFFDGTSEILSILSTLPSSKRN